MSCNQNKLASCRDRNRSLKLSLRNTFALFSIEILTFIKNLPWWLSFERTPVVPHWSVHLMDGLQHIFFQGCLSHDAVLHCTWFCYQFFALEFIANLILSFRSQTLTLRFSLKISLVTKQNTFLRSSILNNFSI